MTYEQLGLMMNPFVFAQSHACLTILFAIPLPCYLGLRESRNTEELKRMATCRRGSLQEPYSEI